MNNSVHWMPLTARSHYLNTPLCHGDLLEFVREPTNRFDPNAIRVTLRGQPTQQVGYVPRNYAALIAPQIDSGYFDINLVVARCPHSDDFHIQIVFCVDNNYRV